MKVDFDSPALKNICGLAVRGSLRKSTRDRRPTPGPRSDLLKDSRLGCAEGVFAIFRPIRRTSRPLPFDRGNARESSGRNFGAFLFARSRAKQHFRQCRLFPRAVVNQKPAIPFGAM